MLLHKSVTEMTAKESMAMYYHNEEVRLARQVENLLEKKVCACLALKRKDIETQQSPYDFFHRALRNDWKAIGIQASMQDDMQALTLRFDDPNLADSLIELEFARQANCSNEFYEHVTLVAYWGKYEYATSTGQSKHSPSFDGLVRLVKAFPEIAASMQKRLPVLQEMKKEREDNQAKKKKATEIRKNAIKALLAVESKKLELTYCIVEMATRVDLFIRMPDQTRVQFQVPIDRFEDLLSEIPSLIQQCVEMYESKKTKILIYNSHFEPKGKWVKG